MEGRRSVTPAASSHTRSRPRLPSKWVTIALFLLPALALYLTFVIIPIIQAAHFSLYKWNGLSPLEDFVGLKNYEVALASDVFRTAVSNNLLVIVLSLLLQIPFSLALAVLLNRRFPGRAVFRLLFFVPYVLSEAITGIVFRLLLQPGALVDSSLQTAGLGGLIQDWLGDANVVMLTLFVIISWKYFGFHMIILLAGLQGIPREIEDAALIDGAGRWQAFRFVTLPLLGPTLRVSVFLSMIGALQLFDMVWVMTGGGPLNASTTMAIDMFKAGFKSQQMGYGSALAVILFICALVVALLYQRYVLRRDVDGAITAYNG
jgi:raffinose/stachyose/melibiose transport system permease protein